ADRIREGVPVVVRAGGGVAAERGSVRARHARECHADDAAVGKADAPESVRGNAGTRGGCAGAYRTRGSLRRVLEDRNSKFETRNSLYSLRRLSVGEAFPSP